MIKVLHAKEEDLDFIVNLHLLAFKGLFAADVQEGFIRKFYKAILDSKEGAIFVARNAEIKGFICGVTDEKRIFSFSFKLGSLYYILKRLITNPKSVVNLLRFIKKNILTRDIETKAELISIVVSEEWRKRGVGRELVNELFRFFSEKGVKKIKVFTATKVGAGPFYEALGFILVKTIDLFGTELRCYTKELIS